MNTPQLQQKTQQREQQNKDVQEEEYGTVFRRSSRILRSPILTDTPKQTDKTGEKADSRETPAPQAAPAKQGEGKSTPAATKDGNQSSPKQEYITQMRRAEEESLEKCKGIVQKMKLAMAKQKNVSSMDVKNGAAQLDELFDVIKSYRRNWLTAETEKRRVHLSRRIATPSQQPRSGVRQAPWSREKQCDHDTKTTASGKKFCQKARKTHVNEGTREEAPKNANKRQPANNMAANQKGNNRPKRQTEAVIIKPAEGNSYAEVLKNIRSKVDLKEAEVKIKGIRKTRAGALLLELEKGQSTKTSFCEALKSTLKETATVADLKTKVTIEIRDLDSLTTKEEVAGAVKEALQDPTEGLAINITAPNTREQVRAYLTLDQDRADALMRQARIKIGWVSCRLRLKETPKRCFRCFGPGHLTWDCKGPDRRGQGVCIKCGQPGHKLKDCEKLPSCCLCKEAKHEKIDHIPGSAKCTVYRNYRGK
ncbi:uncharacterized protein LOC120781136 [Bactrocera tryoni]|uniref:uncharacterized protein LOC120781136 n=1 Tax=Bactrocera tryoni TaxID=59916 RepID=UPI001A96A431|nr:uncharacterized protein LOC120781136 [Bactrocera tryoni]